MTINRTRAAFVAGALICAGAFHGAAAEETAVGAEAVDAAPAIDSSDFDAFLTSVIGEPADTRRAHAEAALQASEAAVAADPDAVDAHMLRVAALGTLARTLSRAESIDGRYGSRSRDAVADLLDVAPDKPGARALAGVWNLEVVRRGGLPGSLLLGASVRQGRDHLDAALAAESGEANIPFAYAVALLSFDAVGNSEEAERLLVQTQQLAQRSGDGLSSKLNEQSQILLDLLSADRASDARVAAIEVM